MTPDDPRCFDTFRGDRCELPFDHDPEVPREERFHEGNGRRWAFRDVPRALWRKETTGPLVAAADLTGS